MRIRLKSPINSAEGSVGSGTPLNLILQDGDGYAIADAGDSSRFVSLVDRALAAVASPQGYNGYHAAVVFNLGLPIDAATTGTLTVSFADGILGDEVVGVTGAGDFICTDRNPPLEDTCVHTFAPTDADKTSLSLVLSLAIFGDASLSEADLLCGGAGDNGF